MQQPNGNEHPWAAPHGVYPCGGDDRWIAISVMNNEQWAALVEVLGAPEWARDEALRRSDVRHARRKQLDSDLAAVTVQWVAGDLMHRLQARGVPAGVVQTAADVVERDPQLKHRGHWIKLHHPKMGAVIYNAPPMRFSRIPVELNRPAPLLGEHTEEVCRELLGMTPAEVEQLAEEGVLR